MVYVCKRTGALDYKTHHGKYHGKCIMVCYTCIIIQKMLPTMVGHPMSKMVVYTDHNKGCQKAMHQIKA